MSAPARYVPRADGGAVLARRLQAGLGPILLTGPPGVGCSTELAATAPALAATHRVELVRVDEIVDPADFTTARLLFTLARLLVEQWATQDPPAPIQPTPQLIKDLRASDPDFPQGNGRSLRPAELLAAVLDELAGASGKPLAILVDGLDHADPERARAAALACLALRDRAAWCLVLAPAATVGPGSFQLNREARVAHLDPLNPEHPPHADLLFAIAAAHRPELAEAADARAWVSEAARLSGGLPRILLQLVADALAWAGPGGDPAAALADVARDHAEALRRLLLAGDLETLAAAEGTHGMEVPADRRARLLDHGLMLERHAGYEVFVAAHPLLAPWLPQPAKAPSKRKRKA